MSESVQASTALRELAKLAEAAARKKPTSVGEAEANVQVLNNARQSVEAVTRSAVAEAQKTGANVVEQAQLAQQVDVQLQHVLKRDTNTITTFRESKRRPPPSVQVAVMIDGTQSMQEWMDGVHKHITEAARQMANRSNFNVRLALVLYRDYGDAEQFVVQDFTDAANFVAALKGTKATGGDDVPEDVLGGFHKLDTALSWDDKAIHACVWCCDAPGHGMGDTQRYGFEDRYPHGDLDGRTIKDACAALERRRIEPVFLRLHPVTDKMIEMFDAELTARGMPRIPVISLKHTTDLGSELLAALLKSSMVSVRSREAATPGDAQRKRKVPTEGGGGNWADDAREIEGKVGTFGTLVVSTTRLGADILAFLQEPMELDWREPQKIRIANAAFQAGGVRFAFHATRKGTPIVTKDFQRYGMDTLDAHLAEIKGIACASYLASYFCDQLKLPAEAFRYVGVATIDVGDGFDPRTADRRSRFYSFEEYLTGEWEKMNCNTGFCDNQPKFALAQAFSHFTYHATDGKVMVLDVQGVVTGDGKFVLSDPAVQTRDPSKFSNPTNVGHDAMVSYFQSHVCNEHCAKLKLPPMQGATGVA